MAKKSSKKGRRKQTKSREEGQTPSPIPVSPTFPPQGMPAPPQPTATAPPIPLEVRDELTAIMQQLILQAQDLSFEYSTLDCEEVLDCQLARKCKELFKVVKRLREMLSKLIPPAKTDYVK